MSRPQPPLVGRAHELELLEAGLIATAAGAGGCTVLNGPPGIGKTRMLAEAARRARELGLAVAAGAATDLDRVAPLTTLISVLRRNQPDVIELPVRRAHEGDRLWYLERLGEALEQYVGTRPLVAIIDDAQWTDEFSALALRVLVPALSSSAMRWVIARRPAAAASAAQEAIDGLIADGAQHIPLGPLDDGAVTELCSIMLDADADPTVLRLAGRASGNPFLLEQLLRTLRDDGQIVVGGGIATVIGDELPGGFVSAVEQRLRGLSPLAIRLLQAGSVFARPFTLRAAASVLGVAPTELLPASGEAVAVGILFEDGPNLLFCHDLLREAVYNHISGPARAVLHQEAATVVRVEGRSPVEIANHLIRSGHSGDRAAVDLLRQASDELAEHAPATAADLLTRALDMLGPHDDARPQLTARAVSLLALAGRQQQAQELGEAALHDHLDPATEAWLLLGLAEALKHAGQNAAAVDYAHRGLARSGRQGAVPDALRAQLHAIAAHGMVYIGDMRGADEGGAAAETLGEATGEHSAAVFGSAARSIVARNEGRLADALAHARNAVRTADTFGGPALHRHPRIWLGGTLVCLDRFAEAEQTYAAGRREADRRGETWSQPLWHFQQASLLTWQGALGEAVAEAEAGLRVADQITARQMCVPLLGLLTRIATARGQLPVARDYLRRMRRFLTDGITAAPEDDTWSVAVLQEAEGKHHVAVDTLADIYRLLPRQSLLINDDPAAAAVLVRTALAAGAEEQADIVVTVAADVAARNPGVASLAAAAAHAHGLRHGDVTSLRRAVDLFANSPRPLARASACEDAAWAEDLIDNRPRAVELLEQALDECATAGATRATARLERRLRQLGLRRRGGGGDPGPTGLLRGLTRAELGVARLVAEGLTNRAIADQLVISPHTVDSHLRHIFDKLAVNSRVAVTRIVTSGDRLT